MQISSFLEVFLLIMLGREVLGYFYKCYFIFAGTEHILYIVLSTNGIL